MVTLPFLSRPIIEHIVQGEVLKFRPASTGALRRLRSVGKPIIKAIGVLFSDRKQDVGQESVTSRNPSGEEQTRVRIDPMQADLLQMRSAQRDAALEGLIDGLLGTEAAMVLADLLWDALPDTLPASTPKGEREAYINQLPAESLLELVNGLFKANEKVLGPLKDRAGSMGSALKMVLGKQESPDEPDEPPSQETQTMTSG
jgi:hypothetical protein